MTISRGKALLWILALIAISSGATIVLLQQAKRFSTTYAKAEADKSQLVASARTLTAQIRSQQEQLAQQEQAATMMTTDRDSLLALIKQLREEQEELASVAGLHERVLKRTAQENRTLKERLLPMERDHADLQEAHAALRAERTALQRELDELTSQPLEKKLKAQLDKAQKQHAHTAESLAKAQQRIQALQSAEAKVKAELPKLQQRLDALQEKYTKIISENKTLAFKATHVPKDVTTLAREHQRMLRDLADTHYNLGVLFAKKEDFVRAVKEFQQVVELRPDDPDAHYNLGLIYAEHLPDRGKAMRYFGRYLEINPRASDASWVKSYIASWKAWEAEDRLE